MTILVFGKTGQVAQELAAYEESICVGRDVADLSDPAACADLVRAHSPKAVINAAAYTAVDKAEDEEDLATVINGAAPTAIAEACAALGIPFVHISTDYVFDGTGTAAWTADDPVAPPNAYGRSKLAGENGVVSSGAAYAILRTSWVVSAHGHNFVKTMLRLGAERDKLTIVADQIGAPTSAKAISRACMAVATQLLEDPQKAGIYHFQSSPYCSWADLARELFQFAKLPCVVEDIPSSAYPTPATRPLNSRLDCTSFEETFKIPRPDWKADLRDILEDLEV